MGAFDQFKDKAEDYAAQAKGAQGGKRNKSANPQNPEQAERGMPQEGQERRRSEFEDQASRRMGREAEDENQDDWA